MFTVAFVPERPVFWHKLEFWEIRIAKGPDFYIGC